MGVIIFVVNVTTPFEDSGRATRAPLVLFSVIPPLSATERWQG